MGVPAHANHVYHQGNPTEPTEFDNFEYMSTSNWKPNFNNINRQDPNFAVPWEYYAFSQKWTHADAPNYHDRSSFPKTWLLASPEEKALLRNRQARTATVAKWALHSAVKAFNAQSTKLPISENLPIASYTASNSWTSTGALPNKAFDGKTSTSWNAGNFAVQWIEVDLGQEYYLDSIQLLIGQLPAGNTTHEVWVSNRPIGNSSSGATLAKTFQGFTDNSQWLQSDFSNSKKGRYVQVKTVSSPSWVAWIEIQLYGEPLSPRTAVPCNDREIQTDYEPNETGIISGYHHYEVKTKICSLSSDCTIDNVFKFMKSRASYIAPVVPDQHNNPVTNCMLSTVNIPIPLVGDINGTIRTVVDDTAHSITNFTRGDHPLRPGKVIRTVVTENNSVIIQTIGEGSGLFPSVNMSKASQLWSNIDNQLKEHWTRESP